MSAATASVAAALGAAVFFGAAMAVQHREAVAAPVALFLRPRLLTHLLRRPGWVLGTAAAGVGLALHVLALNLGQLAVVQPLLVTDLLFALPVSAALQRRPPVLAEWLWATVTVAGLAGFLVFANPSPAAHPVDLDQTLVVLVPLSLLVAAGVAAAWHGTARQRSLVLGLAAGCAFGVTAAAIKAAVDLAGHGAAALVTGWPLYALLAIGLAGLMLNQSAFQAGPLGPGLAALTIANPLVSIALGITGFGEHLAGGAGALTAEVAGLAVMVLGVAQLARLAAVRSDAPSRPASRLDVS